MNSMKNWVKIVVSVVFIFCILVSIFLYNNRCNIYANLGKFYAKKGEYNKAQIYYEKSYLMNYADADFRENYVNLIINSPLTIEAQNRLVDIAEGKIKDNASESAKYFLFNLKREINNKYPKNYIQLSPYNQKIVHWGKLPITYSIKQTKNVPPELAQAVNDAFDTWERASSVRIRFEKVNVNPNIVVNFIRQKELLPKYGEKYVVAYTIPEITDDKLVRMDMVFNILNIEGNLYTPNQIYNTALHEIFHALGFMGHCSDKENIMYMSNDIEYLENNKRKELTDADKSTLELLYKIKPDITNSDEIVYEYISYPVLGDSANVNYAKADEAKNYIRKAPKVPAGYIDLAQTYMNEKNYHIAIINLEKALELSRNNETKYLALYNLAVANFYEGAYELTLFYIQKAQELKDVEELHTLAAQTYLKTEDIKNAEKEFLYLTEKKPGNIEYAISLANLYIKKHNYLKARKTLKTFIKNNPKEKNNPRFKPCKILLF